MCRIKKCDVIRAAPRRCGTFAVRKSKKIMNLPCNTKKHLVGKSCLVGLALVCAAITSSALTLGRLRGVALLGQPLDVAVAVQPSAGEDASGLCFEADVFYGETRVDASRFRVRLEAASQPQNPSVRISSTVPVDEPVVTVTLRAGCAQKISRRYVLLADQVGDVFPPETTSAATSAMASPDSQAMSSPVARPADAPRSSTRSRFAKSRAARPAPGRAPKAVGSASQAGANKPPVFKPNFDLGNPGVTAARQEKSQPKRQGSNPIESRTQRQAPSTGKPLLKLDPADLPLAGDAGLRLSQQLNVAAIGNEKLRAEAAALWLAINANPLDVLRESQRVKSLEADVATLRTLTGKSQQTLAELTQRLQKAESERWTSGLAYVLAGLAALALAAATYFWARQRRQRLGGGDWWHSSQPAHESVSLDPAAPQRAPPATGRQAQAPDATGMQTLADPGPAQATPAHGLGAKEGLGFEDGSGVDIALDLPNPAEPSRPASRSSRTSLTRPANPSGQAPRQTVPAKLASAKPASGKPAPRGGPATTPAALASLPAAAPDSKAFPPSMGAALRAINTEELLDIRQQADFFLSLGQYDRAIQILEARIHERAESSPLVYLDLLKLLHALDRVDEYQRFERDFNQRFRGRAVSFSEFGAEGQGLDVNDGFMARLSQVWPSERALELMEDNIFRNEEQGDGPSYDLAAFRELLMLHGIARELVSDDRRYDGLTLDIALD